MADENVATQAPAPEASPEPAEQRFDPTKPVQDQEPQDEAPPRKVVKVLDKEYEFDPDFPDDKVQQFKEFSENLYKDYQTKTRTVAEERRMIDAARAQVLQEYERAQNFGTTYSKLSEVQSKLKEWEAISTDQWKQALEADPAGAQKALAEYQTLQIQQGKLQREVEQANAARQQSMAQIIERGRQMLAEKIPDWGETKQKALLEFGREVGFTDQELNATIDPRAVMLLHDAYLYRQSLKRAVKESEPPPAKPQPTAKVGASASAARNPDNLPMMEWLKWREGELQKKRRR